MMLTVAAIQMVSGIDVKKNLAIVNTLIKQAADSGAQLAVLPENFASMSNDVYKNQIAEHDGHGLIQDFLKNLAQQYQIDIIVGTIPIKIPGSEKTAAACLYINSEGKTLARYDKIHLFDVLVDDKTKEYKESATIQAGKNPCVVTTKFGKVGLAVCYDMRFPELFRIMHESHVSIIAIPAAFTKVTGKAHWDILLRARAIENLSFVIAAAQGGVHENLRETYGHSMIIDPWGAILKERDLGDGVVLANLDFSYQEKLRKDFPVLDHVKLI